MANPFGNNPKDEVEGFFTAGNVAAKFPTVGHTVEGTVLDWSMRDQTDADSGEIMYRVGNKTVKASETPNKTGEGFPVAKQLLIDVQGEPTGLTWETNRYDPVELDDDDGTRTFWVKGTMKFAINQALQKAGRAQGQKIALLEKGAYLKVTRVKDGPQMPGAKGAPYRYEAEWIPAAKNAKAAAQMLADDPWASEEPAF